jgi:hypothetical protein
MQKTIYVQQITNVSTALALAFDNANSLVNAYFDRSYNSGGANEIVTDDLAGTEITVGQITAFITLAQQLQLLRNNSAVATADYDATLNALRRDI